MTDAGWDAEADDLRRARSIPSDVSIHPIEAMRFIDGPADWEIVGNCVIAWSMDGRCAMNEHDWTACDEPHPRTGERMAFKCTRCRCWRTK